MTKGTPAKGPVGAFAAISAAAISGSVCSTELSFGIYFRDRCYRGVEKFLRR